VNERPHVPIIYNLFPRHLNSISDWNSVIPHIGEMGFNAVFVNPFHETGASGSLYSVKDYFRLNPLFLRPGQDPSDFSPLKAFIASCADAGLELIMDLVINHTATDSLLVKKHPAWYKRDPSGAVAHPFAIDPGEEGKITVWGDLASIDNDLSEDRQNLWNYWDKLIAFYQEMGIHGFRCDAAYQVPAALWTWLIRRAKQRYARSILYAETLGCRLDQIQALSRSGFDYLFNSVKWWNHEASWALDQHAAHKRIAPSIGFAESHDTERLASVHPGTVEVQKSRYAFAAFFSQGMLMTAGFEYGAAKRMDVVRGTPADVEKPRWDMTSWIARINALKLKEPVLSEEGSWTALCDYERPYLFLKKTSDRGHRPVCFCINKRYTESTTVDTQEIPQEIRQCKTSLQIMNEPFVEDGIPEAFLLEPAEIVVFM
jgi:starch synthase (maltosyl-transferring)